VARDPHLDSGASDPLRRQIEFRYNNDEGAPHIDGTIILDGDRYGIRGVEWLVRREDHRGDDIGRFICTLVVEPDDDLP
jgi:hypothetical protein